MNETIRITPAKMVTLGAGWFGVNFFWAFNIASMPLFLKNFTVMKFTISLILSFAGIAGCLVPPTVGYLSDRSFTRFGRRKPYIFFGMLGVLICMVCLPHFAALGMVALTSGLMYFSLRFAETPYLSLLPDITPPRQRSTASSVMNLLGSIGLIVYFVISSRIWDKHPTAVFSMVALVLFGSMLITLTLTREPEVGQQKHSNATGPLEYLRGMAKEINVLRFFIAQFFWWLGFYTVSSFFTLFVVEDLKVTEGESLIVPMVFSIVATLFMLPLGILGDRYGRKGILSFMIAFWAVSSFWIGLSQNFTHVLITVGTYGIPYAAVMGVGYAYMLDLIPGERTAEFVGFNYVSAVTPLIFGPLIGGKLIDMLGYRSIFPAGAILMVIGFTILQFIRPRQGLQGIVRECR